MATARDSACANRRLCHRHLLRPAVHQGRRQLISRRRQAAALFRGYRRPDPQSAITVRGLADQTRVQFGGLAKYLQRPPTANGVAFGALEDETGMVNLTFSPPVWERCRRTLLEAPAVLLDGHVERAYDAVNVLVHLVEALAVASPAARRRRLGR